MSLCKSLYRQCLRELPRAASRYGAPFDAAAMKATLKRRFTRFPATLDPALARPHLHQAHTTGLLYTTDAADD